MLPPPRRHFLAWDRPLLPQAVAFLAGSWAGTGPLDLSDTLVVVPTRQSGRRLREALAEHAAQHGGAVFPPRVVTPEVLVAESRQQQPTGGHPVASRLEALLAWSEVLRGVDLDDFREVFPIDPPARNFAWALRLAEQFVRLETALAENDLRIADVPRLAGSGFPEIARWQQLAALAERQAHRLATAGRRAAVESGGTRGSGWSAGVARIVVLATIDPMPAAVRLLATEAERVVVVVYARPEMADDFDDWGRPLAPRWQSRLLELPAFQERVHLCSDPADEAARLARLLETYAERAPAASERVVAVGIADPEIAPLLESEAARGVAAVFNPEGRVRRSGALYPLLAALADAARGASFESIVALVRCPDFLAYLARRTGASPARVLEGLDQLRQRHLPADLAQARRHARAESADALDAVAACLGTLSGGDFPATLAAVLAEVFGGRMFDPNDAADAQLHDAAAAWTTVVRDCSAAAEQFPSLAPQEWWELALRLFGDARRTEDKPAGAVALQGWLELLYEDAPHLVVAGLNDGLVPEAVTEDPFLPEPLRARLGLRTNATRFARDAYLLEAVAAGRATHGRVDVLFAKVSGSGDPLRPSRLLLRCADEQLPERIAFLFRAPPSPDAHLPWTRAWKLAPRRIVPPAQVAVTALRRWLACPFRFYLQYGLRMEPIDAAKAEMDAFDFGSLCHFALEAMGREPALRDCTDAAVLREFLLGELSRRARDVFGAELSLPLVIQVESARQRLAKVAELQARERAEGWVIQEVERPFTVEIAGVRVKGKIDRIDRHARTGAVRVLDYKTSDTAVSPRSAHLRTVRATESLPDWAVVPVEGKLRTWTDLQLPLYRHALAPEYGADLACGYVNLPKAVGQTTLCLWDDYTLDLQAAALRCAEGVCSAIARGEFWPPNEEIRPDTDVFAALFHHGAADSIAWAAGAPVGEVAR